MQIVIDIPEEKYRHIQEEQWLPNRLLIEKAIANGIPLPKGHGRLIDADALVDSLSSSDRDIYCKAVIEEEAPTIVAADNRRE